MPVSITHNSLPSVGRNGARFLNAVIRAEAFAMERDMKQSMKGQGKGITYKRGNVTHQASAPGDPPARDSGYLADSIHVVGDPDSPIVFVAIDAEYAAYLEHGTYRMAPRPFVAPAVHKCEVRLRNTRLPVAVLVTGIP